jgi:hypothetical protein
MRNQSLRGVSSSTLDLVKQLSALLSPRTWIGNLVSLTRPADEDAIAILNQIGRVNEPLAIRELLPFGLMRKGKIRAKARSIIQRFYSQILVEALPVLDEHLRQGWHYLGDWYDMRPDAVDDLGGDSEADKIFLGLVASNRSGYVRAAAIRALGADTSALGIPFLLVRLTDWVREVQMEAETVVRQKLSPEYAGKIVDCLGLLERFKGSSRFLPAYSEWIDDLLVRPECVEAVRSGMRADSREVRRNCYRSAVRNPALRAGDVIEQAISDRDVIVRKWAFAAGFDLLPERNGEWLSLAVCDPYGPIRRIAFETISSSSPACREDLVPFLLDRSASIRHECQSLVAGLEGGSPAEFYRDRILQPGQKNADISLIGLAETGDRTDGRVIAEYLTSSSARIRSAVIRALRILGVEGHEPTLLRVVSTDVPSVARSAAFTLLSSRSVTADAVWAATLANRNSWARVVVLSLLKSARKWEQLRFYLEAAADSDPCIAELAARKLARWLENFNRTFAPPSASDLERCVQLAAEARPHLPVALVRELDFILDNWAK